jgi:hypothetical protein
MTTSIRRPLSRILDRPNRPIPGIFALRGEERERLWGRWLELQPQARAAEAIAGREIPVFVLE